MIYLSLGSAGLERSQGLVRPRSPVQGVATDWPLADLIEIPIRGNPKVSKLLKKNRDRRGEARARETRWVCWGGCGGKVRLVMEDQWELGDVRDCEDCGDPCGQEVVLAADVDG